MPTSRPAPLKDARDKLEALRHYTKSATKNRTEQNGIAELKVLAEWRGGALLREIERGSPGPKAKDTSHDVKQLYTNELSSLNLNRMTAWRWQVMSYTPEHLQGEPPSIVSVAERQ